MLGTVWFIHAVASSARFAIFLDRECATVEVPCFDRLWCLPLYSSCFLRFSCALVGALHHEGGCLFGSTAVDSGSTVTELLWPFVVLLSLLTG